MKHCLTILTILLSGWLWGQNCPIEAPLLIPANDSVEYSFEVFDVLNNNLAAAGQGVCGVNMRFRHNSITDFEVWLTSPGGTTIQLIGPNATVSPATLGGTWNVTFLRCLLTTPMPQVPYGSRWNNSTNPFGSEGITGSYLPYLGCLEEFNTGPVNGTWKLKLKTLSSIQIPSRLVGLDIQFCDKRGQRCCFADAGVLNNLNNVSACQYDNDLNLALAPTYPGVRPDSSKFGYTFAIGRDMILQRYDSIPDLRQLAPGNYQVCGLSYARKDSSLFPAANNVLRLDTLRNRLLGDTAPFCGEMTSNCVNVIIAPRNDSTVLPLKVLCEGDSVVVNGRSFKATGRYYVTFNEPGRCDSLVVVPVLVQTVLRTTLDSTICAGDSVRVGTSLYKTSGNYVDTLQSRSSCDSIIALNLRVLPAIPVRDTTIEICAGRSVVVAGQRFSTSGTYTIPLVSSQGCDSLIRLTLNVISPTSIIAATDTLITCTRRQIVLDGTRSTPLGQVTYRWEDNMGNPISDSSHYVVTKPDTYYLQVVTTQSLCAQRVRIIIAADTLKPVINIRGLDTLDCRTPRITLSASNSTNLASPIYSWTTGGTGRIEGASDRDSVIVSGPGFYNLQIDNTRNGCSANANVQVIQNTSPPIAIAGGGGTITCTNTNITLSGAGSSQGASFQYRWRGLSGQTVTSPGALQTQVRRAGAYELAVTNAINHCVSLDTIIVAADTTPVQLSIDIPRELNCINRSVTLNSRVNPSNRTLLYDWSTLSGGNITGSTSTPSITVDRAGSYALEVTDQANGCTSGAVVAVKDSSTTVRAIIATPAPLSCTQPNAQLDGTGSLGGSTLVYRWSTVNGKINGVTNQARLNIAGPGTYQLLVRDSITQCRDSAVVTVNNDSAVPVADAGVAVDLLTCQNPRLRLNGLNSSGGSDFEYTWSGTCIIGSSRQPLVTVSCAGSYKITVRNKINGCIAVDSVEVFSNQVKPRATVSPNQTLTCDNPTIQIPATLDSAGAQFIKVQWTGPAGGGIISPDTLLNITVNKPGQYILRATNRQNGCVSEAPANVFIDTMTLRADAGTNFALDCKTPQGILRAQNLTTGPRMSYTWSTNNGVIGAKLDSLTVTALEPGTYRFVVRDTFNGCFATDSVIINNDRIPPIVQAGADQELTCSRPSVTLNTQGSATGSNIQYTWRGPCTIPDSTAASINITCEGQYVLRVTNTVNGCFAMDSVLVNRNPLIPNARVVSAFTNVNCTAGEAILSARGSSGGQIRWVFQNNEIGRDTQLLVREPGTYLLVINNATLNCADSATVIVSKDCRPTAIIANPTILTCRQAVVTLDGSGSSFNASIRYRWIGPGGRCIISDSTQQRVDVICPGTYQLIIENLAVNERDTATVVVSADQILPVAMVAKPDTITCTTPNITLDGRNSTQGANVQYTWLDNQGQVVSRTLQAQVNNPGLYALEVLNTSNGCFAQTEILVPKDTNFPQIILNTALFPCNRDTFSYRGATVLPQERTYQFRWTGPNIVGRNDTLLVNMTKGGQYILSATDLGSNCIVTDTITIQEQENCDPCVRATDTDPLLTCTRTELVLPAAFCRPCVGCTVTWTSADGNFVSRSDTIAPRVNRAGIYNLTVIDSNARRVTLSIQVRSDQQLPILPAGFDANLTCGTQQIALPNPDSTANNPITWNWTTTDGLLLADTIPGAFQAARMGTYRLTGRNVLTSCESFTLVRIGLDTLAPRAAAGADAVLDCSNQRLTLNGNMSSVGPGISYVWTALDNGRILAGENSLNPIVDAPGLYLIRVEDGRNQCADTDTLRITPDAALPPITPIADQSLNCRDTVLTLMGSMPTGGNYTGNWCALGANRDTLDCFAQANLRITQAGVYSYELTDTRNNCRNRIFVTVSENNQGPVIDAGNTDTLRCDALSLRLKGDVQNPSTRLSYSWSGRNNPSIQADTTLTPTIISGGWYRLQVQNRDNFCSSLDSVFIASDLGRPQVAAGQDTFLNCVPLQISLQGRFSSSGGETLDARWTANGGRIISGQNTANAQVDQPGIYRLTVRNTVNNCVAADEVLVSNQALKPSAQINGPTLISCNVEQVTLSGAASTNPFNRVLRYFWTPVGTGRIIGSPADDSMRTARAGLYRLIVTDALSGCQDSTDFALEADQNRPRIDIAPPATLSCSRSQVRIDASGSATGVIYRYSWRGPNGQTLTDSSKTPLVTLPGIYRLTVRNAESGCISVDSAAVTEDYVLPRIRMRALDVLDCVTSVIELEAGTSQGRNLSFRWSAPQAGIVSNPNTALIRVNAPGLYRLVLTDGLNGCSSRDSLLVQEAASAIDSVVFNVRQPGCGSNQAGQVVVTNITGGTAPYLVLLNNSLPEANNTFRNLRPGTYNLNVKDAGGCLWTSPVVLQAPLPPAVELGPDREIKLGDSVSIIPIISTDSIVSINWSTGATLSNPNARNQLLKPSTSTTAQITIQAANGCTATDLLNILVIRNLPLFVPNVFSPNGDGINDLLNVYSGSQVNKVNFFRIYDRWGNQVYGLQEFRPNDMLLGWDGTFGGETLNSAVFTWYAEVEMADGKLEKLKGSVTLMR